MSRQLKRLHSEREDFKEFVHDFTHRMNLQDIYNRKLEQQPIKVAPFEFKTYKFV
jgi:hypothetical protein